MLIINRIKNIVFTFIVFFNFNTNTKILFLIIKGGVINY